MPLSNAEKLVKTFHEKYGFPVGINKIVCNTETEPLLHIFRGIQKDSELCLSRCDSLPLENPVSYRVHLMLEEMAEVIEACVSGDLADLAKELSDLLFVVIGTAVQYGIPISECFAEVSRANLTKQRLESDPRMRIRGNNYDPPLIKEIIFRDY